jgi:hypothetical protein
MQNRYDHHYQYFYKDSQGNPRKYGIFAPGVNRFILIDENDMWVTLQTAELLSSKLPTVVYALPINNGGITAESCINFTIADKTQLRVGFTSIVTGKQTPMLKILYDTDALTNDGLPEGYKDNLVALEKLLDYAEYVHKQVYAMNIAEAVYNLSNSTKFADLYIGNTGLSTRNDLTQLEYGVFFEIRKILYLADNIEQAETEIINCWANNSADQSHVMAGYYKVLNETVPEQLKSLVKFSPENLSLFLF